MPRIFKRVAISILKLIPPLPTGLFDRLARHRLGTTPLESPQVLFVSNVGAEPVQRGSADLPQKAEGCIRIVVVSDTHEAHRSVTLPHGDVLLHCGDILWSSSLAKQSRGIRVLEDFNLWLGELNFSEIVVIGGNHDIALQKLGDAATGMLSNAVFLQDESVVLPFSRLKVYGNAFSRGHSHNTAWQDPVSVSEAACKDVDVVMTHHKTSAIVDAVLVHARPKIWASGHNHAGHGVTESDGTLLLNGAIMDGKYNPTQLPVVIDFPKPAR